MISVRTDKPEYKTGDMVVISGNASRLQEDHQVVIQVYNPQNVLSRMEPVNVSADGSFSYLYVITGPLNQISGQYRIVVTYGWTTEELSFMYTSSEPNWLSYRIQVDGKSHEVRYNIQGGTVQSMESSPELATLTVTISSKSDGQLIMRLPRLFLGPDFAYPIPGGSDIDFEVFIDGVPGLISEPNHFECQREVTIQFEAGAEEIELIGPWFPPGYADESPPIIAYQTIIPIKAEGEQFDLQARMNAESCSFSFTPEKRRMYASLDGPSYSQGYFEITLPHRLLGGSYTVLLNNEATLDYNTTYNRAQADGVDSTTISLGYDPMLVGSIDIIGTTAIPEFNHLVTIVLVSLAGFVGASRSIMRRY